jgi:lipopolysaccharide biosynthesis glycosyltransferase
MNIDLVTASDKNFGQHTGIMLMSLLDTHQNIKNSLNINILDGGILPSDKEKINRICSRYGKLPTYIHVDNKSIGSAKINGHISIATYYRILLPNIFPSLNKILYIDSDVIVTAPLNELWSIELEDNYAAAVQDSGSSDENYIKSLGLPSVERYFNAGILLINLRKWREDAITNKLIQRIQNNHNLLRYWDQDALNSILWKKIKIIDPKFNMMVHFFKKHHQSIYSPRELDFAKKNPFIIHYNSQDKPWYKYCQHKLKGRYHFYWKKSEWSNTQLLQPSIKMVVQIFLLNHLPPVYLNILKKVKRFFIGKKVS